jgi:hypothetical protein
MEDIKTRSFRSFPDFAVAYCGAVTPAAVFQDDVLTCFRSLQVAFYPHEVTIKNYSFGLYINLHNEAKTFHREFLTGSVVGSAIPDQWFFERYEDAFHFRMRF